MKYTCLVYFEEKIWDGMSESDIRSLAAESVAYDKQLQDSGHYIFSRPLESVRTATTVRMRDGKTSITDGPFGETKEVLGGFIVIDARDLDDAIQVAAQIPLARLGSIEVRPVLEMAVNLQGENK